MSNLEPPLTIDPEIQIQNITALIQQKFRQLNRTTAIIGLSGGLDSSLTAVLAAKSLGADRVRCYYLPDRDSKPHHRIHAQLLAQDFDLPLTIVPITPALRALRIYSLLPLSYFPSRWLKGKAVDYGKRRFLAASEGEFLNLRLAGTGGSWVARGNAYASSKHRVRNVWLYREAERLRGMVIGAANRTEYLTGTFTQWGCDHCADLMPIVHLYRSQLRQLAEYLALPQAILAKHADPDVMPGLDDKGKLLGSFEKADQILWGLENNIPLLDLERAFGAEQVEYLKELMDNSAYYRETPYSLL